MIAARQILESRLLAALEQETEARLPPDWSRLRPDAASLRPAAALLLRIAGRGSREEMSAELRQIAARIAAVRAGRKEEEKEAGSGQEKEDEEKKGSVWLGLAAAIDRLDELQPGGSGLWGLQLWQEAAPEAVNDLWVAFRAVAPPGLPVEKVFLTAAARVLLRALARRWTDEDRE